MTDFTTLTVTELKALAKEWNLGSVSKLKKAELVDLLKNEEVERELDAKIANGTSEQIADTEDDQPTKVAVARTQPGKATATATYNGNELTAVIRKVGTRWELRDGNIHFRSGSLEKLSKKWARRLGFWADTIEVTGM